MYHYLYFDYLYLSVLRSALCVKPTDDDMTLGLFSNYPRTVVLALVMIKAVSAKTPSDGESRVPGNHGGDLLSTKPPL